MSKKQSNLFNEIKDFNTKYAENIIIMEDSAIHSEMQSYVREAINRLSVPLRTVLVLYYLNEMSTKEIAIILGCLQGTVKSRLYNARKILKKALQKYTQY